MTESTANNLKTAFQKRRFLMALGSALAAVVILTPVFTGTLGTSPRKTSVSILRFAFLFVVAFTCERGKLAHEAGLLSSTPPWRIWLRGFFAGAIPLTIFVVALTLIDERIFEGIVKPGKFWWAVVKYLPLSVVIGFLEDMLFFGFLVTLFGQRLSPAVLVYAVTHFLSPSKSHEWQMDTWLTGLEALGAMSDSLAASIERPVELFGLILVGAVLAALRAKTGHIWASMGVHGGWYYVRTISRKLGEDLEGSKEWLFGTDRFYDGALGWVAIACTGIIFWFTWKEQPQEEPTQPAPE